MMKRLLMTVVAGATLGLLGCSTPETIKSNTLTVDVQPDFMKLSIQFVPDRVETTDPAHPQGELNFGDTFLWTGDLFEVGTAKKIGTWICTGTKFSRIQVVGLDKPYMLTGLIEKNMGQVAITFAITGKGAIQVTGLEAGYDGKGGLDQAIVGGTGDFAYATGIVKKKMALPAAAAEFGQNDALSPAWAATQNDPTFPAVTVASHRMTFEYNTPQ